MDEYAKGVPSQPKLERREMRLESAKGCFLEVVVDMISPLLSLVSVAVMLILRLAAI